MTNLAQCYDVVGVKRNAPQAEVYEVYNHWRDFIRPLMAEEAGIELNQRKRGSKKLKLVEMDDAFTALLAAAPRNTKRDH